MTTDESPFPVDLSGTVLCIEDQPIGMAAVEGLLSVCPAVRLLKAFNGADGIRLARGERPDLVLLDMNLPDMSGVEVMRALSDVLPGSGMRVVLLTSESFSIDVVKAMSLGAHEYWPKPLTLARALAGLQATLRHQPPRL
jgi:hypothetical protein